MGSQRYILALDQGTTGSRAFIFDDNGRVLASAYQEFKQHYPKPGWVEHDADEIWASVCAVTKKALKKAAIRQDDIAGIGITNQRETVIAWDRQTSRPLHKAIVWQDRRTADMCRQSRWTKIEPEIRKKTGLLLDPYFSGTKMRWMLDHVKGLKDKARKGQVCFGTIDTWLIWKLTGGEAFATDMTNASRTLLFNIRTHQWDDALLKSFGVPKQTLPQVQNSGSCFGKTVRLPAAGLQAGIPITAVLGDQQAALYGQGCFSAGTGKNTYGTGCFLVVNTGDKLTLSRSGLLSTVASDWKGRPVYALEGAIFIAGAVVQWLRDELKLIKDSASTEDIARSVPDTNGVYVVPAFAGLGAPYWDPEARGAIFGLTRGANRKHIVRAALESIAYQTRDVFAVMEKAFGKPIKLLKVDGGACRNNFLMQFQADLLQTRVERPVMVDSTVLGAAQLAGVTAGLWTKRDLERQQKTERTFRPKMKRSKADALYKGWEDAVRRTKSAYAA